MPDMMSDPSHVTACYVTTASQDLPEKVLRHYDHYPAQAEEDTGGQGLRGWEH